MSHGNTSNLYAISVMTQGNTSNLYAISVSMRHHRYCIQITCVSM
jgi:hypothetical protein